jgi:hypothetical protein
MAYDGGSELITHVVECGAMCYADHAAYRLFTCTCMIGVNRMNNTLQHNQTCQHGQHQSVNSSVQSMESNIRNACGRRFVNLLLS